MSVIFFTAVGEGGEKLASRPGRFIARESSVPLW
jgi:hypothetical protein